MTTPFSVCRGLRQAVLPAPIRRAAGVGLALCLAGGWQAPVQAGSILFQPTPVSVQAGASFSVDLVGQGFAEVVDGGGLSFSFDAALLQVTGVSVDAGTWDFFTANGSIDNVTGLVSEIQFAAVQTVTGAFSIATISMQALAAGVTDLVLSESTENPFASDGGLLAVTLMDGSVDIAEAAAPAPWLLLLGGLAAVARVRRGGAR